MGREQRLIVGLSTAEAKAADLVRIEIEFATHETMLPERIDREGVAQEFDRSLLIGQTQIYFPAL